MTWPEQISCLRYLGIWRYSYYLHALLLAPLWHNQLATVDYFIYVETKLVKRWLALEQRFGLVYSKAGAVNAGRQSGKMDLHPRWPRRQILCWWRRCLDNPGLLFFYHSYPATCGRREARFCVPLESDGKTITV